MNKCNRIGLFAAAAAAVTTDLSYPPFFQEATGDELTRRAQAARVRSIPKIVTTPF
jgi:hypothetical protein